MSVHNFQNNSTLFIHLYLFTDACLMLVSTGASTS